MKARAGVIHGVGQEWKVDEIEVDAPKAGEVLVEWKAAGLCHSDEHLVTGDMVPPEEAWPLMGIDDYFPIVGGHEGAGVVAEVGPGVTSVAGRRPRVGIVHPVVRSLPLLLDRSPEPVRRRCRRVPEGDDHRRHEPPPRRGRQGTRCCSPSSARSPSSAACPRRR